jgi:hypothetical protein
MQEEPGAVAPRVAAGTGDGRAGAAGRGVRLLRRAMDVTEAEVFRR